MENELKKKLIYMEKSTFAELENAAKQEKRSVNNMIEVLLLEALQKRKIQLQA